MHKNCATVEFRSADGRRWIGVRLRSKAAAVGAPTAEVESLAENYLEPIRVHRPEFAQAAHSLRTIARHPLLTPYVVSAITFDFGSDKSQ
jgi:hypothetical protein